MLDHNHVLLLAIAFLSGLGVGGNITYGVTQFIILRHQNKIELESMMDTSDMYIRGHEEYLNEQTKLEG